MNINWSTYNGFLIFENLIPGGRYQIPRKYLVSNMWTIVAKINVKRPAVILSQNGDEIFIKTSKIGEYTITIVRYYKKLIFYINGTYTGMGDCNVDFLKDNIFIDLRSGAYTCSLFMLNPNESMDLSEVKCITKQKL